MWRATRGLASPPRRVTRARFALLRENGDFAAAAAELDASLALVPDYDLALAARAQLPPQRRPPPPPPPPSAVRARVDDGGYYDGGYDNGAGGYDDGHDRR